MPVKLMTSPGLMDLSISSTKPLTKLAAMACRPKPRPMPTAPVSTVSAVRSTPAALMPSSTPRPSRKKYVNLLMPMRVDSARPSSFMTRASMVREMRLAATRNTVTTTTPLSSDQMRELRLARGKIDGIEPGFDEVEPAQQRETDSTQNTTVKRSCWRAIQLRGPIVRASR